MFRLNFEDNKQFDIDQYDNFKKLLKLAQKLYTIRINYQNDFLSGSEQSSIEQSSDSDSYDEEITQQLFTNNWIKNQYNYKENEFAIKQHNEKLVRRNESLPNRSTQPKVQNERKFTQEQIEEMKEIKEYKENQQRDKKEKINYNNYPQFKMKMMKLKELYHNKQYKGRNQILNNIHSQKALQQVSETEFLILKQNKLEHKATSLKSKDFEDSTKNTQRISKKENTQNKSKIKTNQKINLEKLNIKTDPKYKQIKSRNTKLINKTQQVQFNPYNDFEQEDKQSDLSYQSYNSINDSEHSYIYNDNKSIEYHNNIRKIKKSNKFSAEKLNLELNSIIQSPGQTSRRAHSFSQYKYSGVDSNMSILPQINNQKSNKRNKTIIDQDTYQDYIYSKLNQSQSQNNHSIEDFQQTNMQNENKDKVNQISNKLNKQTIAKKQQQPKGVKFIKSKNQEVKGLRLINQEFIFELDNEHPSDLDIILIDFEHLQNQLKLNKYDSEQSIDEERLSLMSFKFRQFLIQNAKLRDQSPTNKQIQFNDSKQNTTDDAELSSSGRKQSFKSQISQDQKHQFVKIQQPYANDQNYSDPQLNKKSKVNKNDSITNFYKSQSSFADIIQNIKETNKKQFEQDEYEKQEYQDKLTCIYNKQIIKRNDLLKPKINTNDIYDNYQEEQSKSVFKKQTIKQYQDQRISTFKKYLSNQRIDQINKMIKQENQDPISSYYQNTSKHHLYPRTSGFADKQSNQFQSKIQNQIMSQRFTEAFCKGIRVSNQIMEITLRNNNLSTESATLIIKQMNLNFIKVLDISYNHNITDQFYQQLGHQLSYPEFHLQILVLEGNKMKDQHFFAFDQSLNGNKHLKVLNLNSNNLGNQSAQSLSTIIKQSSTLISLFLHYNKIRGEGGIYIAQELKDNKYIQIFDISFNSIGRAIKTSDKNELAQKWAECFEQNQQLIHVDISNNDLKWEQMNIIGQGLMNNHTIVGLHVKGNEAQIDSQGFIVPQSELSLNTNINLQYPLDIQNKNNILKLQSNCWLCDRWKERTFEFTIGQSDNGIFNEQRQKYDNHDSLPIYIHLQCDNYQPCLLIQDIINPKSYRITRMLPSGNTIKYFFSILDRQLYAYDQTNIVIDQIDKYLINQKIKSNLNKNIVKEELEQEEETIQINPQIDSFNLDKTNIIYSIVQNSNCFDAAYLNQMQVKPRQQNNNSIPQKPVWDFTTSSFRLYKQDSQNILDECFENDWSYIDSHIKQLVNNDDDQLQVIKDQFKYNYHFVRDAYKITAGQDSYGDLRKIESTTFKNLIQSMGDLIDNKTISLNNLDNDIEIVKFQDRKMNHQRIPIDGIIRYNFLELMIRITYSKYIKNQIYSNWEEGIQRMSEDYFQKYFAVFNTHIWRQNHLWNEECDLAIKRQYKTIQKLFEKYSANSYQKGRLDRFVKATEFAEMITSSKVYNEKFTRDEVFPLWNISMMTQADEINKDRHLHMEFPEFIEAICRVAEMLAIPNLLKDTDPATSNKLSFSQDMLSNFKNRPLHEKIEAYLLLLSKKCLGKTYYQQALTTLKQNINSGAEANNLEVSGIWKYKD